MLLSINLKKIKLTLWVCWTGGEGRKVQEKEEGVKKDYFPRKENLTYYSTADRKNVSETGL